MNNENQWERPTPLRQGETNLLPFPVNALPPILREMASAIATTTSTDPAMAGTAVLSAVSYCFSGMYRMSAKRDHTEPLVLNALTVAEPSFKKSPVISMVKRPYIQFAHDWNESNKQIQSIRQNDLYKLCRCTLFKNAADFGETMDMLEEYGYIHREKAEGANGNNKSGIMVFINPNI